jgi:hypothetical protein
MTAQQLNASIGSMMWKKTRKNIKIIYEPASNVIEKASRWGETFQLNLLLTHFCREFLNRGTHERQRQRFSSWYAKSAGAATGNWKTHVCSSSFTALLRSPVWMAQRASLSVPSSFPSSQHSQKTETERDETCDARHNKKAWQETKLSGTERRSLWGNKKPNRDECDGELHAESVCVGVRCIS